LKNQNISIQQPPDNKFRVQLFRGNYFYLPDPPSIREIVSKYRLVEAETGIVIRHYIRTLSGAEQERKWYEEQTGREIRIVKLFRSDGYQ
jgi:hypothetical protein